MTGSYSASPSDKQHCLQEQATSPCFSGHEHVDLASNATPSRSVSPCQASLATTLTMRDHVLLANAGMPHLLLRCRA